MLSELLIRFAVGGLIVTLFAVLGDVFRPKSFAGIFDAAPSVALATLALTAANEDSDYAALEARSMLAGALALAAYSQLCAWLLMRRNVSSLRSALAALPLWFAVAFLLWLAVPGLRA
ncbi:MAG TPA: DUF3147 family protein [Burkholderiales bacterium]|nr:DUF3147 family protein [Burkholderiales bacterium]